MLLRLAAGAVAAAQGLICLNASASLALTAIGVLSLIWSLLLITGLLTPSVSIVLCLETICYQFSWLPVPQQNILNPGLTCYLMSAITIALALLGPGAISLDASIYGRRKIIFPDRSKPE